MPIQHMDLKMHSVKGRQKWHEHLEVPLVVQIILTLH